MTIKNPKNFASFPVIAINFASLISTDQKLSIITKVQGTSITSTIMTGKFLSSYSPEIASLIFIDDNLIIGRLPSKELAWRMHSSWCNCMHFRFRYVSSNDRNSILPNKQLFIIRWTDEFVLLDEGQSVNGSQMLLISHHFCSCSQVKLIDLFWTGTTKKYMWEMFRRMIFQGKWYLL